MSWLRIDDGFANHPKVAKLSDRDFRVWMRTLCYCARYENPTVGESAIGEVKGLTEAVIERYAEAGLLDTVGDIREVHDWLLYTNAPVGDKVAYYLAKNPAASANQIVKALASKRNLVLAEVRRQRPDGGSLNGTPEPHDDD